MAIFENINIILGIISALGPLVTGVAFLWLKSTFVTKEDNAAVTKEMELQEARINRIDTAIVLLIEQMKAGERYEKMLGDHEQRIRDLERSERVK